MNVQQKQELGQFRIDEEKNQITFTDLRFYKDNETGEYFPSVTTILDAYPKPPQFYEWLKKNGDQADEIRDEAGRRGSKIHKLIENYNNGEVVRLMDADGVIRHSSIEWAALEKWVDFTKRFKPEILRTEFNVISRKLKTAGTIDNVMKLDGKKLIVDFKSSNSIYEHFFIQMAAYKKIYEELFPEEEPIEGIAILWLSAKTRGEGKKGQYQGKGYQLVFPEKPVEHYWKLFQHTQALWNEVNEGAAPKELVYQLEHKLV